MNSKLFTLAKEITCDISTWIVRNTQRVVVWWEAKWKFQRNKIAFALKWKSPLIWNRKFRRKKKLTTDYRPKKNFVVVITFTGNNKGIRRHREKETNKRWNIVWKILFAAKPWEQIVARVSLFFFLLVDFYIYFFFFLFDTNINNSILTLTYLMMENQLNFNISLRIFWCNFFL